MASGLQPQPTPQATFATVLEDLNSDLASGLAQPRPMPQPQRTWLEGLPQPRQLTFAAVLEELKTDLAPVPQPTRPEPQPRPQATKPTPGGPPQPTPQLTPEPQPQPKPQATPGPPPQPRSQTWHKLGPKSQPTPQATPGPPKVGAAADAAATSSSDDLIEDPFAEQEAIAWAEREPTGDYSVVTAGAGDTVRYPVKLYQVGKRRCVGRRVEGGNVKVIRWLDHSLCDDTLPLSEEEGL
jgi:hypothetical protein